jgi:hypothetical protein
MKLKYCLSNEGSVLFELVAGESKMVPICFKIAQGWLQTGSRESIITQDGSEMAQAGAQLAPRVFKVRHAKESGFNSPNSRLTRCSRRPQDNSKMAQGSPNMVPRWLHDALGWSKIGLG